MTTRELLIVPGVGNPDLYSGAALFGNLIWTSGQVPAREDGAIPRGIRAQMEVVFDNLESTLAAAGGSLDTILKVNGFLASLDDFEGYNEAYLRRLAGRGLPPRTTVEVTRFPPPMRVELEVIAHRLEHRDL